MHLEESAEITSMQEVSAAVVPRWSLEVELHRVFTSRMASSSLSSQRVLSAFPFLTPEEFECACRAFLDRIDVLGNLDGVGWSSIRFVQQVAAAFSLGLFPTSVQ